MTTIRDVLNDFAQDLNKISEDGEEYELMLEGLIDEAVETIKERIVG